MVLGTTTTATPRSYRAVAAPSVSSPPIATSASTPRPARLSLIRSTPDRPPADALSASGLVREVPSIVPPRGRIPRTACTSSGMVSPSSGPRHPSRNPVHSYPYSCVPRRTSARMTAFSPGQSPPPVSTPTRMGATLVRMSVLAIDAGTTGVTALVVTAEGTVAARGYAEFPQHYPRPGWVEHLPEDIWQATLTACRQALDVAGAQNDSAQTAGTAPARHRLAGPQDGPDLRRARRGRARGPGERTHRAPARPVLHRHQAHLAGRERGRHVGRFGGRVAGGRDGGLLPHRPAHQWA